MARRRNNLTGQKFNKIEVLGINQEETKTKGKLIYDCLCDCGTKKTIACNHIKDTKSCGCLKNSFEDLKNRTFGRLRVISYAYKKRHLNLPGYFHYWNCECECGNKTITNGHCLKYGNTLSCGCLQEERCIAASLKHGLRRRHMGYNPEYEKLRRQNPNYVIRKNCRVLVYCALKRNGGSKNGESFLKHVDYTLDELRVHLENQFEDWMSWKNYGEWHIDHIIPQINFNYKSMTDPEFKKCWALANLRPLSKIDNLRKGRKVIWGPLNSVC